MDIFEQTRIQSLHFVMYSIILWAQIHFIIYEFRIYFFVQDKIIRRIANVNMFSLHIIFRAYKDVMMEWLVFKLYRNRYTIRYKMILSIIKYTTVKYIIGTIQIIVHSNTWTIKCTLPFYFWYISHCLFVAAKYFTSYVQYGTKIYLFPYFPHRTFHMVSASSPYDYVYDRWHI